MEVQRIIGVDQSGAWTPSRSTSRTPALDQVGPTTSPMSSRLELVPSKGVKASRIWRHGRPTPPCRVTFSQVSEASSWKWTSGSAVHRTGGPARTQTCSREYRVEVGWPSFRGALPAFDLAACKTVPKCGHFDANTRALKAATERETAVRRPYSAVESVLR